MGRHLAADDRQLRLLLRLVGRHDVVVGPDRGDHAGQRRVRRLLAQPRRHRPRLRLRVGQDHRRRQVAPEQRVHPLAPVPFARLPGVAPPQPREVELQLVASEVPHLPDRPQREQEGGAGEDQGTGADHAGDPSDEAPRVAADAGRVPPAVEPAQERRHEQHGRPPGERHPEATDHPELPEAAELHGDQRRVGDAGRQRRRQRPPAGPPQRHDQRLLDGLPLPARLEVPRELDDAEVDPVADDDRPQERRVRVELGDPERRQAGEPEGVDRRERQRQEQRRDAAGPAVEQDDGQQHGDHDEHRRERQVLDQRGHLLGRDGDVAGQPDLHAGGVGAGPSQRPHVVLDLVDEGRGLRGAGREAADLDQHQRQAQLAAGEAVPLEVPAAELAGVLVLDVAEVERRRRLVGVEERVGLLAVLPVKAGLDPLPDRLQIVERHQAAGVLLDEGALRRVAGAHVADLALGVAADARGEILQEPLARRQVVGGADVDDDAQVLQPGHAAPQLLDGHHARGVARQELLDVAAQVTVEGDGPPDRRNRRDQRDGPEQRAMTKRPGDETAGTGAGRR